MTDLSERLQEGLHSAYTIERELVGGGMSRVFVARELALGRRVVIKTLPPELAHELSAERFAREIRLAARLQHPNIVPVLATGIVSDISFYTMPFIEGESLRHVLTGLPAGQPMPYAQALDVLRDLSRALAYAHDEGIIHRDVKPENILIGRDGVYVTDFGVARAVVAARTLGEGTASLITRAGMSVGTPAYMAPEQASGDPDVDHQADIYAWGVVAYELLAGRHPFADKTSTHALVAAQIAKTPRHLRDVAPLVHPRISDLVMRCLEKSRADRPSSGREIAAVLSSGQTTSASRWRPRATKSLFITVGLLLGVIALATTWKAWSARPSATDDYLRGKVRASSENREDNDAAIALLRSAIAKDPTLAAAHAELAHALNTRSFYLAPHDQKKQINEDAEVELEKALTLDPDLAIAHYVRGVLLWTPARRFPHEQAMQAQRRALQLDPKLDVAHEQMALIQLHVGLLDEAEAEVDTALAINPGNALARYRYGVIDLYRGRYERAYSTFKSTPLERNPSLWAFQMAVVLIHLDRDKDASDLVEQFLRDYPRDEGGTGQSVRAILLAKAGRRADAEAAIATAEQRGKGFGHFHHTEYNIGVAYALLNAQEDAIRFLQRAADNGFPCYPLFIGDPYLRNLQTNARYVDMMTRMKQEWTERKQRF